MSPPRHRHSRIVGPLAYQPLPEGLIGSPSEVWSPLEGFPGYLISTDGRLAREVKVRTNKNGTRFARVSIKGKQHVVRL